MAQPEEDTIGANDLQTVSKYAKGHRKRGGNRGLRSYGGGHGFYGGGHGGGHGGGLVKGKLLEAAGILEVYNCSVLKTVGIHFVIEKKK